MNPSKTWSQLSLFILLMGWTFPAHAIDIVRLYIDSCQSKAGFIIGMDKKDLTFLSLDGVVEKVERSGLHGVALYSVPAVSFANAINPATSNWYTFETYRDGRIVPLGTGWLIGFTKEKIAILNQHLEEQVINRDEIWGVAEIPARRGKAKNSATPDFSYVLRDPLLFAHCPLASLTHKGLLRTLDNTDAQQPSIIPKLTLDEPIGIKRYFDNQLEFYDQVGNYIEQASFYAVPQKFKNRTFIGTWGILGSRYANVGARQTNFLPLVEDQFSEGPFGFQRVVRSGVSPLSWGIHEEPVVQVFYGLKADYIHLDVFVDPTSIMIGRQYDWKKDQLDSIDDRYSEPAGAEFGFDIGNFSLFFVSSSIDAGVRVHDFFLHQTFALTRGGLSYQWIDWKIAFYVGQSQFERQESRIQYKFALNFFKVLLDFPLPYKTKGSLQLINRKLISDEFPDGSYSGDSKTVALRVDVPFQYRWTFFGLFSAENQTTEGAFNKGVVESKTSLHPKAAGGISYDF